MSDSLLGNLADQIEAAPAESPPAKPKGDVADVMSPPKEMPDLVGQHPTGKIVRRTGRVEGVFVLDSGFGFELIFSDGRERRPRNLPRYAVEFFGDLDDPHSLPRWLFYHELLGDVTKPIWHGRYSNGDSIAESIGLPADWAERDKALKGVCCHSCGRSLFWSDLNGREFCACCHPRKFKDERDLFNEYFKLPGHPHGCDDW